MSGPAGQTVIAHGADTAEQTAQYGSVAADHFEPELPLVVEGHVVFRVEEGVKRQDVADTNRERARPDAGSRLIGLQNGELVPVSCVHTDGRTTIAGRIARDDAGQVVVGVPGSEATFEAAVRDQAGVSQAGEQERTNGDEGILHI